MEDVQQLTHPIALNHPAIRRRRSQFARAVGEIAETVPTGTWNALKGQGKGPATLNHFAAYLRNLVPHLVERGFVLAWFEVRGPWYSLNAPGVSGGLTSLFEMGSMECMATKSKAGNSKKKSAVKLKDIATKKNPKGGLRSGKRSLYLAKAP